MTKLNTNALLGNSGTNPAPNNAPTDPISSSPAPKLNLNALLGNVTEGNYSNDYNKKTASLMDIVKFDDVYKYAGDQIGYVTKYPTYATWRDNEDYYAQQQGGGEKFWNTMKNLGSLGVGAFIQQAAELPVMLAALGKGDWSYIHENQFAEGMAQKMTAMSYVNPIYETAEQTRLSQQVGDTAVDNAWLSLKQYVPLSGRAGNAWANLGSQLGFTLGTLSYVAVESAALGLATAEFAGAAGWARLAMGLQKVFKGLKAMDKVADVATSALRLGSKLPMSEGRNLIAQGAMLEKGFNYSVRGLQTFKTTLAEGGMEGAMIAMDFKKEAIDKIKAEGRTPTTAEILKIEKDAEKAGNYTLNMNIPILMISNALTLGKFMYGKGTNSIKNPITDMLKPVMNKGSLSVMTTKQIAFKEGAWGIAKYGGKGVLYWSKNSTTEGIEELLQGIAGKTAKKYVEQMENPVKDTYLTMAGIFAEEASHSLQSREGWDEFWAGFLTGVPITIAGGVKDRITGETAAKEKQIQTAQIEINKVIANLPDNLQQSAADALSPATNKNLDNILVQFLTGYQSVEATNKGEVKRAKDFDGEGKAAFFYHMMKYDMLDDMIDQMGDAMEYEQKTNPGAFKTQMGDRSIEDVKNSLREDGKAYDKIFTEIDKNLANPYDKKKEYTKFLAYEQAKRAYTDLKFFRMDSTNRAKSLFAKLSESSPISQMLLEVFADPNSVHEKITKLEQDIESAKDSSIAVTAEEKATLEKELKALKAIKKKSFKEDGSFKLDRDSSSIVKEVVKVLYGREYNIDSEQEKDLVDLIALEDDAAFLLHVVNSLNNKEYFEKFADKWQNTVLKSATMKDVDPNSRTPEGKEKTKKEAAGRNIGKTDAELNAELKDLQGGQIVIGLKDQIQTEITVAEDGSYDYNGQKYATIEEALEAFIDNAQTSAEAKSPEGKALLIEILKRQTKGKFNTEGTVQNNEPAASDDIKDSSELRREATEAGNGFSFKSAKIAVAHFFDYVVSKLWTAEKAELILDRWLNSETDKADIEKRREEELKNNITFLNTIDVRRPNGSIGTQGFTETSFINLARFISNKLNINIPAYDSTSKTSEIAQIINFLKNNETAKQAILEYVKSDPIVADILPDGTYHFKDGNHRANLLNLIGVEQLPIISSEKNKEINDKYDAKLAALEKGYIQEKRRELAAIVAKRGYDEGRYSLLSINLSNPETLLKGKTAAEYNAANERTQIIIDENTGRVFVFVAEDAGDTAQAIAEGLSIKVRLSPFAGFSIVEDLDGNILNSDYFPDFHKTETKVVLNGMKTGDSVELRVANSNYNKALLDKLKAKEISKEEYDNNLGVEVVVGNTVVGILRAADFLFDNTSQQTGMSEFRDIIGKKLATSKLGKSLGFVRFKNHNTTRGYNINKNGQAETMSVNEFIEKAKEHGHKVEIFVATAADTLVDKNGKDVTSKADRGNFTPNQAYMRVTSANGLTHVVAITQEGKVDVTQESLNEEGILDKLETVLDPKMPIITKRAILDLSVLSRTKQKNDSNDKEVDLQDAIDGGNGTITFVHANGTTVTLNNPKVKDGQLSGDVEIESPLGVDGNVTDEGHIVGDVVTASDGTTGTIVEITDDGVVTVEEDTELKAKYTFPKGETFERIPSTEVSFHLSEVGEILGQEEEVEEVEVEEVEEEQNNFPSEGTQKEKSDWVHEFGEAGETYQISETKTITPGAVKNTFIEQTGDVKMNYEVVDGKKKYSEGHKFTNEEYNDPSDELLKEIYQRSKIGNISFKEKQFIIKHLDKVLEIQRKEEKGKERDKKRSAKADTGRTNRESLSGMYHFLTMLGEDGDSIILKLYDAYRKSVEDSAPFHYVNETIASANLTEGEKNALEAWLNSGNSILLWSYITQADAVAGLTRNNAFAKFRDFETLRDSMDAIESSLEGRNSIPNLERNPIIRELFIDMAEAMGVAFSNIKELHRLTAADFRELVKDLNKYIRAKIDEAEGAKSKVKDAFFNLLASAGAKGISLIIDAEETFQTARASIKSKGRELFVDTSEDFSDFVTNLNKGLILNEKDGLLVELSKGFGSFFGRETNGAYTVSPELSSVDAEELASQIWTIQKLVLSLGLPEISTESLEAYQFLNGDFSSLKARLIAEKLRSEEEGTPSILKKVIGEAISGIKRVTKKEKNEKICE
jgi:hypothetical protein